LNQGPQFSRHEINEPAQWRLLPAWDFGGRYCGRAECR